MIAYTKAEITSSPTPLRITRPRLAAHDLDRDLPVEFGIVRKKDRTETAAAELVD